MATLNQTISDAQAHASLVRRNKNQDILIAGLGMLVLVIAISTLLAMFIDLFITGLPRLQDPEFYMSFPSRKAEQAGILSAWVGTIMVMAVTASISVPLGVAAGVYLEEYAGSNWVTDLIEINVTNLAGVPSIVYGLLALGLFIYAFGMSETVLVAGMVLSLLILPVIIVSTREAIRSIPEAYKEAAIGLGADQWQTTYSYILPAARPGIITGAIVGLSRAIGETAPIITIGALTYIAFLPNAPIGGDFPFINFDWITSPFTVMPIQIFGWTSQSREEFAYLAAALSVVSTPLGALDSDRAPCSLAATISLSPRVGK